MIAATGPTLEGPGRLSRDPVVESMSKSDFLLIAGGTDIAAPRGDPGTSLQAYRDLPCSVLFIDGPGDDHDLYREYPQRPWNGGLAQWFCRGVMRLCRGQVFTLSGLTVLAMGGGTTPGRDDVGRYWDWWPEQDILPSEADEAVESLGGRRADVVLSDARPSEWRAPSEADASSDSLSRLLAGISYGEWLFSDGSGDLDLPEHRARGLETRVVAIG